MDLSLKYFVENSIYPIAMFDRSMNYMCWSAPWRHMFLGKPIRHGQCHYELLPDLPENWKQAHRDGMAGKMVRGLDERFEFSNGKKGWLRWQISPWYIEDNNVGGIIIAAEDITQQKEREAELNRVLARFELVQQAAKIGMWDWDVVNAHSTLNAEYYELYGLSPNLGLDYYDFLNLIDVRDRARVDEVMQLALNGLGKIDFEYRIIRARDGKERWIKSKGRVDFVDGRPVRAYGAVYDITQQKLSSLEPLKSASENYEKFYDDFHEGVWVIDANGITTFVNHAMAGMLGYHPDEMIGRSIYGHMEKEWRDVALRKFMESSKGQSERYEFKFLRKDGAPRWGLVSAKPVFDDNIFSGAIAVVMDYSEQKNSSKNL